MNQDILLHVLKHGDSYTTETEHVLRPPTKYTLAAARVIEALCRRVDSDNIVRQQLENERNQALDEITKLKEQLHALQITQE